MGLPFIPLSNEQADEILKEESRLDRSQLQVIADEHASVGCCQGCLEDGHDGQCYVGPYCCCALAFEVYLFLNPKPRIQGETQGLG